VRLRPVAADRLALALEQPQPVDDGRTEQENKKQRGDHRAAGAERDVAEHIEDGELVRQIDQPIKHTLNLMRTLLPPPSPPPQAGTGREGAADTPVAAP